MNPYIYVKQIFKLTLRELKLSITSPLIYVIFSVYIFIQGLFFFNKLLQYDAVVLQPFFQISPYLVILSTLIVSSGLLLKRKNFLDLQYLLPVSEFQIVFSKFLSISVILFMTLLISSIFPLAIKFNGWGNPDLGLMFSGLLGIYLMSLLFIALGLSVSAFSSSQTTAFLVAFQIAVILIIPQFTNSIFPSSFQNIFDSLGIVKHLYSFSKGLFIFHDFTYFVLSAIFLTILASSGLKWRKYTNIPPFSELYIPILFFALFIFIQLVSLKISMRIDLTSQKLHTLDSETLKIVKNVKKDIKIIFFCSEGIPHKLKPFKNEIVELLEEYERVSSTIKVAVLDPDKSASIAKLANDYGLTQIEIGKQNRKETSLKRIYFGIVVIQGEKTEIIQDSMSAGVLEYEITSRIKRLISPKQKIVFTIGHGELPRNPKTSIRGSFDFLIKKLKNFNIKLINPKDSIPADTQILVLAGPTEQLDEQTINNIKKYLKSGKSTLFLLDGMKLKIDKEIKGIARQWISNETGVNKLLKPFGIRILNDMILSWTAPRLPSGKHGEILYPLIPIVQITSKFSVFPFTLSSFEIKPTSNVLKIKKYKTSSKSWRHEKVYEENRNWPQTKLKGSFIAGMFLKAKYSDGKPFKMYLLGDSDLFRDPSLRAINTHILFMRHIIDKLLGDHSLEHLRFKGRGIEKLKLQNGLSPQPLKYSTIFIPVFLILLIGFLYNLKRKFSK